MKKKTIRVPKILPLALSAAAAWSAGPGAQAAELLYAGGPASIQIAPPGEANMRVSLFAYRDADSCTQWYWIPAWYEIAPNNSTYHDDEIVPIYPKDATTPLEGYGSVYDILIAPRSNSDADIANLKAAIVAKINAAIQSGDEPYKRCQTTDASRISLSPLPATFVTGKLSDQFVSGNNQKIGGFAQVVNNVPDADMPIVWNPTAPLSYLIAVDATNPDADAKLLRALTSPKWSGGLGSAPLTALLLGAKADMPMVDATLHVSTSMGARFATELKQSYCYTEEANQGGGDLDFIGIPVYGAGYHSSKTRCTAPELMTHLVSASGCDPAKSGSTTCSSVQDNVQFDFTFKNFDYDNLTATVCLDLRCKEPITMPFQEYVRVMLMSQFLQENFNAVVKADRKMILEPRTGTNGDITASLERTYSMREVRVVDQAFSVPVYLGGVTDISARDVADDERDFPRLACARQHYEDNFDPRTGGQYLDLAKKGYMIPVAAACYAQDPGHGLLAE